jgi:glyoxylase-like metal-dependent hydrolase (beta-lactamase superfamily II)
MSYNAFLVNTGEKLVLIDTGTGGKLADSPFFHGAGRLLTNLRAAGYQPEQIDEIYITHRGQDHIGGLTMGKERTFPNAIVRAPKREFDIFLNPEKIAAATAQANNNEEIKEWMQFTRDLFEPYIRAGKFHSFDDDIELTPGIRALATHGHTPGHTSYVAASKGQTLLVMGDLILIGAIQFGQPSVISAFDSDHHAAATQRRRILELAAENDYWVAGAHLSFPGIGHVRAMEENYRWVPTIYTIPQ